MPDTYASPLTAQTSPTPTEVVTDLPVEQLARVRTYYLLGNLLRRAPDEGLLRTLGQLDQPEYSRRNGNDALATTFRLLGLAAKSAVQHAVDDEFHALFIGLGRGELVPFGSWYLTGFLMEAPLGVLREDLRRLGFERDPQVFEPEDHAGALCEVLGTLVADGAEHERQKQFFSRHLDPWIRQFFSDLEQAENACFYRSVGRLGNAFMQHEARYLAMQL